MESSAADLEQQTAQKQEQAEALRAEAITDRTEADALEAEAIPLETQAQPWVERTNRFRARIVNPPLNSRGRIRNEVFAAVAAIFQGIADIYLNQAADLKAEAQALRDGADQKVQQADALEAEAARLLQNAQQARQQSDQLRSDAEALISLATLAEELAAEYRELAENPKTVQTTTIFIYDQAGQLIGEYKNNGETIKEYIWLAGKPLVMATNDELYYIHTDHLNTPKVLTDQQRAIAWKAEYKPFGEVDITVNTIENNLRFPGQYFDNETGLHYNYFRDYDPAIGKYIESDLIGLLSGINTYIYADQNPIIYIDPLGLDSISVALQGSFHVVDAGASGSISVGIDGQRKVCFQVTTCGRVGPGASGGLSCGIKHNTDDFAEGDSASLGFFGNIGAGPFGSVSVTTNGDSVNTTATIGGGVGIAGGGQACITKTFCVSSTL